MGSHERIHFLLFISSYFDGLWVWGLGGINKVGMNIICLYSFEEYFSFPLVLKQNSPLFLLGIHNVSQGIHFSFKALIFTLLNSL